MGIESDPSAKETYSRNFPAAHVIPNGIEEVSGNDVLRVLHKFDGQKKVVLVGGPPCQPFSSANMHKKHRGKDHPSSSSVDHFARLLGETLPDAFLFENVTTFASIDGGMSLNLLVKATEELGYFVSHSQLEAHNLGVPQHRRRFFLGGMRGLKEFGLPPNHPRKTVLNGEENGRRLVTVRDAISDLPMLPRGGGGLDAIDYPEKEWRKLCLYQRTSRAGSRRLFNHRSTSHSDEVQETMRYIEPGLSLSKVWKKLPKQIKQRYDNKDSIQGNIYYRLSWNRISPTIVHPRRAMLLHPRRRQSRILSVREAARLQGFPDKFRFHGSLDSQYQQVANAVPPAVARLLGVLYRRYLLASHIRPVTQCAT